MLHRFLFIPLFPIRIGQHVERMLTPFAGHPYVFFSVVGRQQPEPRLMVFLWLYHRFDSRQHSRQSLARFQFFLQIRYQVRDMAFLGNKDVHKQFISHYRLIMLHYFIIEKCAKKPLLDNDFFF